MPVSVKNVLIRARNILQDAGSVRWPLTELVDWLNDACRQIAYFKPSAVSVTRVMDLEAGTLQRVPDGCSLLMRAICNVEGEGTNLSPYLDRKSVTPIVREILDQQKPDWHNPAVRPFRDIVQHVIADIADPSVFHVYPGNTGAGKLRATFASIPTEIAPLPGEDEDDLEAYDQQIPELQAIYQQTLVDYVLAMAFAKDMQMAGATDRSTYHLKLFNDSLAARQAVESVANINTTQSQPNS